jgi:hypothetical protein
MDVPPMSAEHEAKLKAAFSKSTNHKRNTNAAAAPPSTHPSSSQDREVRFPSSSNVIVSEHRLQALKATQQELIQLEQLTTQMGTMLADSEQREYQALARIQQLEEEVKQKDAHLHAYWREARTFLTDLVSTSCTCACATDESCMYNQLTVNLKCVICENIMWYPMV